MRWWSDGRVHDDPGGLIAADDRGALLADGVFDTALVVKGRMVARQAHLDRLAGFCRAVGMTLDRDKAEAAVDALCPGIACGALRITVTRGSGPRGLLPPENPRPRILAAIAPGDWSRCFKPTTLATSRIRRNETSPQSRVKTLGYLDAVLATEEAGRKNAAEPLFLNSAGQLACTATGNIFVLQGHRLMTPPLAEGVLPGIVRGTLLRLATAHGLTASETPLAPADLAGADAAFVTNSLRLLSPVTRSDGAGLPGDPARTATLSRALIADMCAETGLPRDAFPEPDTVIA